MPKSRLSPQAWTAAFWVISAVNVGVGAVYSEAARVKIVRVQGCRDVDKPRLEGAIRYALKHSNRAQALPRVESAVLVNSSFQRAELSANPFGRALLKLVYRTPVARIEGNGDLALDAEGVIFASESISAEIPVVRAPSLAQGIQATVLGDWLGQPAAEISSKLAKHAWIGATRIDILADGEVSFTIREKTTVRLGSSYDLDTKLTQLDTLLRERPNLLDKVSVLTLIVPSRPTVVPRAPIK